MVLDSSGNFVSFSPVHSTNSYLDVLPSVQVHFDLGHEAAIRASYGRGLSRPDFVDLTPFVVQDDSANKVSVGNPALVAEHAHNFDLLFEKSLKPVGLFQAGLFYKSISDPIYVVDTPVTTGVFNGFTQEQPVNGSHAHVIGFEVAYQHHLSFLPGAMRGLGIAANYSYTASQARNVPGRTDNPSLLRQAPNTWNVSPTYDWRRLSMRVGISHNDANIFQYNFQDGAPLGLRGPNGDVYLYAHTQIDAQGSFRLYNNLQLVVAGLNLSNEVFGFFQGSPQFPIQREYYHPSFEFGFRYTLNRETQ
jgi:TonB-dependent receptor